MSVILREAIAAADGFTGYSVRGMANGQLNLQEKNFDEALTEIRGQVDGIMKFELTYDEPESEDEEEDDDRFEGVPF